MDAELARLDAALPLRLFAVCILFVMAIKLTAFIVTLLINVALGVAVLFFMLLTMNGFSESDASYGIIVYIVLALLVTLLMSTSAALLVHVLLKRGFSKIASLFIAVPIVSVLGGVLKVCCSVAGVLVAEYVRVHF